MVINGQNLLEAAPIIDMLGTKEKAHGASHGLAEAGYDIRIKQTIRFAPQAPDYVNCVHWVIEPGDEHTQCVLPYRPGRFTLASAIEEFTMPENLVGIVHDKSTWARKGLSVFNTVIEPGWKGFLTLELVYHGTKPLTIPAGAGIAQVVFHQLATQARYTGKYQDQADQPVPAVFAE